MIGFLLGSLKNDWKSTKIMKSDSIGAYQITNSLTATYLACPLGQIDTDERVIRPDQSIKAIVVSSQKCVESDRGP